MKHIDDAIALADATVAKAEECRLEAQATIEKEPDRYAELSGEPSGWCVVTQSGFWSRKYHDRFEESRLRECIEQGDKVVLTVGVVAKDELIHTWLCCIRWMDLNDSLCRRTWREVLFGNVRLLNGDLSCLI